MAVPAVLNTAETILRVNADSSVAVSLSPAPGTGNLVLALMHRDKEAASFTPPAGHTLRRTYLGASISTAFADATGPTNGGDYAWTRVSSGTGTIAVLVEMDMRDAVFTTSAAFPNPVNNTSVSSIAGDLGTAASAGIVFATVSVDSSWDDSGPFNAAATITPTGGYALIAGPFQEDVGSVTDAGGVNVVVFAKEVGAGDPTAFDVSWTGGGDQAALIMAHYAWSSGPPTTTGTLSATALQPAATLTGAVRATGVLTATAPQPTASLTAVATNPRLDTVLRLPTATLTGNVVAQRLEATLPPPTAALTGAVNSGPGSVVRNPRIGVDTIGLRVTGGDGAPVRVDFSTSSGMTSPISSTSVTPNALGDAHVPIPAELAPGTTYYFRPWRNGSPFGTVRSFRTLPGAAQSSMTFGFASCRATDDDPIVLGQLPGATSLFLFIGDIHYRDLNTTNAAAYRTADDDLYNYPAIEWVFTGMPNGQTWDNHDYCGEQSGHSAIGKAAARQVFRERVPTPNLPSASGGIYHSFTAWGGRVRFIMLDTRSYRDSIDVDGTMLGTEQMTWLHSLLANADTPLTFIISTVGWQSDGDDGDWGFFQSERATIASWITAARTECVFLCGDMHQLAIARPSDGTPGGVHVWHAAALRQFANGTKGGPYSSGPSYHEAGQCGLVTLTDTGTAISATFNGLRAGTSNWSSSDTVIAPTSATGPLAGVSPLPIAGLAGTVIMTGALASTPPRPGASVTGEVTDAGSVSATLPSPVAALSATATNPGALVATAPMPRGEIASVDEAIGELDGPAPLPTIAATGVVSTVAELVAALSAPVAALTGVPLTTATLTAALPAPTTALTASTRIVGGLALVVPMPVTRLHAGGSSVPNLVAGAPTQRRGLAAGVPAAATGLRAGLSN